MSDPTAENFVTIVVDGKTYAAFWDVSSDGLVNELSSLKEERDVIRTRVTDMLEQLEALSL